MASEKHTVSEVWISEAIYKQKRNTGEGKLLQGWSFDFHEKNDTIKHRLIPAGSLLRYSGSS